MALKSYEELIKVDVRQYCEERDGFTYLNWAKCIELLRQNGATEVYWEPIPDPQTGSSLRKTDIEFKDKNNNIDDTATDRALLLKFAGTVESGTLAEYGDDGVTQKATVKTGIASKGDAIVPNPVKLKPYRTFLEVDQPASEFVFRMKQDKYDGVLCALFEADGGAWKMEATERIKKYLESELKEYDNFTVIS